MIAQEIRPDHYELEVEVWAVSKDDQMYIQDNYATANEPFTISDVSRQPHKYIADFGFYVQAYAGYDIKVLLAY